MLLFLTGPQCHGYQRHRAADKPWGEHSHVQPLSLRDHHDKHDELCQHRCGPTDERQPVFIESIGMLAFVPALHTRHSGQCG